MKEAMRELLQHFSLEGSPVSCERYGEGHINETYLAVTDMGRRYILQRISERAFQNVPELMENIVGVTEFLRGRSGDPRASMHVVPTVTGGSFLRNEAGCWRIYDFVEGTVCLQRARTQEDFYQSAVGFGTFQTMLAEYPAATLHETIPNFHHTPDRYRIFHETLARDPLGRAGSIRREIDFVLEREEEMTVLQTLRERGELPLRVTHNDTKLNNVLLDEITGRAVCVIDLDTVMPGLAAYDFGDSIRFGAATAAEDERELAKMTVDLTKYETFTRGFRTACTALTKDEIASLPMGAKVMTMECGVRFLTDYLDGDHYFSVHREGQNLDRARTQFRLVSETERLWDPIRRIVEGSI